MGQFRAGDNIAIKVPLHRYDETVAFYRDVVGLELLECSDCWTIFRYGALKLWIDRVIHQSQVDIWLELATEDLDAAMASLTSAGVPVRDELEPLGSIRGHWISDPAGTVLLVHEPEAQESQR